MRRIPFVFPRRNSSSAPSPRLAFGCPRLGQRPTPDLTAGRPTPAARAENVGDRREGAGGEAAGAEPQHDEHPAARQVVPLLAQVRPAVRVPAPSARRALAAGGMEVLPALRDARGGVLGGGPGAAVQPCGRWASRSTGCQACPQPPPSGRGGFPAARREPGRGRPRQPNPPSGGAAAAPPAAPRPRAAGPEPATRGAGGCRDGAPARLRSPAPPSPNPVSRGLKRR